jgi:uncharacterized protein YcfL
MRTKTLLLAALSLALDLSLSSCTATSPPLGVGTNTYSGDLAGKREEIVGDRDLAAKFVLLNIKREQREDGRLRVQLDLKNTTSRDLAIEWAAQWQDAGGFNLDSNTHWTPAIVTGQGIHSIQLIGPTPEAAVFQLQFRKPTPIR